MISICMGYYNRKDQLLKTLQTIEQSGEDCEVWIVDDSSSEDQALSTFIPDWNLEHSPKVTNITYGPKTWVNPCKAYNEAFTYATGDIVIIQNPECMHIGNVLKYVKDNLKQDQYMSFSCLSWDQTTFRLSEANTVKYPATGQCTKGWYHHPIYNNRPYHFCCALHKDNLDKLKGFDERFKDGPCYDDVDFIRRVTKLGLQTVSPTDPYVVHQWHESSHIYQEDSHQRFLNNQKIYNDILNGTLPSWT